MRRKDREIYMAFDGDIPVGAMTVSGKTDGYVCLLFRT